VFTGNLPCISTAAAVNYCKRVTELQILSERKVESIELVSAASSLVVDGIKI
jgi:hypothetical protein